MAVPLLSEGGGPYPGPPSLSSQGSSPLLSRRRILLVRRTRSRTDGAKSHIRGSLPSCSWSFPRGILLAIAGVGACSSPRLGARTADMVFVSAASGLLYSDHVLILTRGTDRVYTAGHPKVIGRGPMPVLQSASLHRATVPGSAPLVRSVPGRTGRRVYLARLHCSPIRPSVGHRLRRGLRPLLRLRPIPPVRVLLVGRAPLSGGRAQPGCASRSASCSRPGGLCAPRPFGPRGYQSGSRDPSSRDLGIPAAGEPVISWRGTHETAIGSVGGPSMADLRIGQIWDVRLSGRTLPAGNRTRRRVLQRHFWGNAADPNELQLRSIAGWPESRQSAISGWPLGRFCGNGQNCAKLAGIPLYSS